MKWRVRYRDERGANRSKRVRTKRQAESLDAKIKEAKALGSLGIIQRGTETLRRFYEERWVPQYAVPQLADSTRKRVQSNWQAWLEPELGHLPLRRLGPEDVDRTRAAMAAKGLSSAYQRTVLQALGEILQRAVVWGELQTNPVKDVRLPGRKRQRTVTPLAPASVEALRSELDPRGATIVSLIAYAGIRPVELRKLEWSDVNMPLFHRAYIPAEIAKNHVRRSVDLWRPLRTDLMQWHMDQGRPSGLVFPNAAGAPMSQSSWNQWSHRTFKPAAQAAGITCVPYDLRHSYISLLIQAGYQILEVARLAGHRPEETLRTYAHLFDEFDPTERINPEELIHEVRNHLAGARGADRPGGLRLGELVQRA